MLLKMCVLAYVDVEVDCVPLLLLWAGSRTPHLKEPPVSPVDLSLVPRTYMDTLTLAPGDLMAFSGLFRQLNVHRHTDTHTKVY